MIPRGRERTWFLCLILPIVASMPRPAAGAGWTVSSEAGRVIEGFHVPESVLVDGASNAVYVANIVTSTRGFWADDGIAWISRLGLDGTVAALQWRRSSRRFSFSAPKGMCALDGVLYAADITRVRAFPIDGKRAPRTIEVPGAKRHNDMATDGRHAYVSDTGANRVVRLDLSGAGQHKFIKAPSGINGITWHKGKFYGVSWGQHDVYQLFPDGDRAPEPFGLARHFTGLDSVEVLDDGTFIVSDFLGNKVCTITPDRKTVRTLVRADSPADIGLDRGARRLFVPEFHKGRVSVYQLVQR